METSRRAVSTARFFAILGRLVATFCVVIILLEMSSFAILRLYGRFRTDPLKPQNSPAYDRESWGLDFWAEQAAFWSSARSHYLPFTVWGVRKWHGKFINTDETEMGAWRRTAQTMNAGCPKANIRKVWVFGGSTVYGIGAPDWATLPSYLSRELNTEPDACIEVTNLGAEGYVTNQEAILLMEQLKAGRRPDIAVFYDGVNESLVGGFSPGIPTAHWDFEMIKAKFEGSPASRLAFLNLSYSFQLIRLWTGSHQPGDRATISDEELAARAQAAIENYEENLRIIQILAKAYDFKAYFFWQPTLQYETKPLSPFEKQLEEARSQELEGRVHRGVKAVYERAENRAAISGKFVFLGHAFDKVEETMYVDTFHLDSRGNEMIAHAIAETLRPNFAATK